MELLSTNHACMNYVRINSSLYEPEFESYFNAVILRSYIVKIVDKLELRYINDGTTCFSCCYVAPRDAPRDPLAVGDEYLCP